MSSSPRRTVAISSQSVTRTACSEHSTRFSLTLMTISRSPAIHARCTQRQYVPSYVRFVGFHSVSAG